MADGAPRKIDLDLLSQKAQRDLDRLMRRGRLAEAHLCVLAGAPGGDAAAERALVSVKRALASLKETEAHMLEARNAFPKFMANFGGGDK